VAPDGVRSTVRERLFPGTRVRYPAVQLAAGHRNTGLDGRLIEVWGPGTEFGALRVSDRRVYWYGEFLTRRRSFDDERSRQVSTSQAGRRGSGHRGRHRTGS